MKSPMIAYECEPVKFRMFVMLVERLSLLAGLSLLALLSLSGCARQSPTGTRGAAGAPQHEEADVIYAGGDIITINDAELLVEALAVKDGRVLAVGRRRELEAAHGGPGTRFVDLQGKTLLPSFIDTHSHYFNALSLATQALLYPPPVGPGKDVPSIIAALKKFAAERGIVKGEMIVGYGYDDSVLPNGRVLNRGDLDEAFPHNPVRVDHVSLHGTVLNSLALTRYGIDANTPTPEGGVIVRRAGTREPWGLIMGTAYLPIAGAQEPLAEEEEIERTRAAQLMYAEAGITTAHEGATHLAPMRVMQRATDVGANVIDVVAFPFLFDLDEIRAEFPVQTWGAYRARLKIGGVKIMIDGSPQGRTAAFSTPYLAEGRGGDPNGSGSLLASQDLLNHALKKVYDLGVPVNVHVNGDAAIDSLIEAHEYAASDDLTKQRRVTAIHAQFIRRDQLSQFVKYKIRPSFYTLHTYHFADVHVANRGLLQAQSISPLRSAIDAGLHPTNHTDAPVLPLNQLMMLWSAVNRISRGGVVMGTAERITPLEGLKTMTIWAAEQYGEADAKGSLERGKVADLIVLSDNPLTVDPMTIKDIRVLSTIKDGQTIYEAPQSRLD